MPGRILIVEDNVEFARILERWLRADGYDVVIAGTAAEARQQYATADADVVVLDYQLPDSDGLEVLDALKRDSRGAVFVMATANPSTDVAVDAIKRGAFDYVGKGAIDECLARIRKAAEIALLKRQMAEATQASSPDDGLVGQSAAMNDLRKHLTALDGAADTTVLITGETGTGKGVVARYVHAHSRRRFDPFVAVDCTTIPPTLIESELFGHEKGAFSGATSAKLGRVEAAGIGTLFLDEIGELGLPVQTKLLRLLEEREYTRVGETRTRELKARIVTATNRDLEAAVAEGTFRADLRYRLEVFVLRVPALRERGEDMLLLAKHFAAERSRALGRPEPSFHPHVIDAFRTYPFPGNVRELRNMVEQALLLSRGDELTLEHFPVLRSTRRRRPTPPPMPAARGKRDVTDLAGIRARVEDEDRKQIEEAVVSARGNVAQAARALGISRYQLIRRMRKLGLS